MILDCALSGLGKMLVVFVWIRIFRIKGLKDFLICVLSRECSLNCVIESYKEFFIIHFYSCCSFKSYLKMSCSSIMII